MGKNSYVDKDKDIFGEYLYNNSFFQYNTKNFHKICKVILAKQCFEVRIF